LDDRRFAVPDLIRWAQEGLISRKQVSNILRHEGLDGSKRDLWRLFPVSNFRNLSKQFLMDN